MIGEPFDGVSCKHGAWQTAMPDILYHAVITDPPYTKKTLIGYRSGSDYRRQKPGRAIRSNIPYAAISEGDIFELCRWSVAHAKHWIVIFNDHIGAQMIADHLNGLGWYVFAPIAWVKSNPQPRMNGDGPASGTEWIVVARPKKRLPKERIGSRPGGYYGPVDIFGSSRILTGQKPLWLMRAIISQYTLTNDVIADPFCGGGTTAVAAKQLGRRCITTEIDEATYSKAAKRILSKQQSFLI